MRWLYLHGFASGPSSKKGVAFADHLGTRGIALDRLDLRKPSFEHLRLTAMIEHVRASLGDRTILIGSSLGGITAARVAERDPRVVAIVLLAPAFRLVERWRDQLGAEWDEWQRTGWREVYDYTTGKGARVDFGFIEDAIALDTGWPDVRVPTLILHGTEDDVVPIDYSRKFAQGRANVTLIELPDGHQLEVSIPRLLAESDRFLAPFEKRADLALPG